MGPADRGEGSQPLPRARRRPGRRRQGDRVLLVADLLDRPRPAFAVPETGDTRQELVAAVTNPIRALTDTEFGPVIRALLGQITVPTRPSATRFPRHPVVRARLAVATPVVRRGIERGDTAARRRRRHRHRPTAGRPGVLPPGALGGVLDETRRAGRRCLPPWLRRLGRRRGGVPGELTERWWPSRSGPGSPWVRWLGCAQAGARYRWNTTTTARAGTGGRLPPGPPIFSPRAAPRGCGWCCTLLLL